MELKTDDKILNEILKQVEEMNDTELERLAAFIAGLEAARLREEGAGE